MSGTTLKTMSMTQFDIVLVPFPFTDLRSTKKRPALIIQSFQVKGMPQLYLIAMMTSLMSSNSLPGDIEVKNYSEAGLPKPTLIRLSKLVTVESSLIIKKIGALPDGDQKRVKKELKTILNL